MNLYRYFKRLIDLFFCISILLLIAPFFLILILYYLFIEGRPIFFTQLRLGKDQKEFMVFKLRTLRVTNSLSEKDLIYLGSFLRKSAIDEIPSLINIFKGEMSLVGPRPLLVEYKNFYNEEENKRHKVLPGLTGLAQIKGRNSLNWKNKFRYDVFYYKKQSFKLDVYIIIKTIIYFLKLKGFQKDEVKFKDKFRR